MLQVAVLLDRRDPDHGLMERLWRALNTAKSLRSLNIYFLDMEQQLADRQVRTSAMHSMPDSGGTPARGAHLLNKAWQTSSTCIQLTPCGGACARILPCKRTAMPHPRDVHSCCPAVALLT